MLGATQTTVALDERKCTLDGRMKEKGFVGHKCTSCREEHLGDLWRGLRNHQKYTLKKQTDGLIIEEIKVKETMM